MASNVAESVRKLHASRQTLVKAQVVGGDRPVGLAEQAIDEPEHGFSVAGALEAPYEPETLAMLLEHSNSLRQCIDAYVTNVHAHGHRFEPIIDLHADDANEAVANLLWLRRLREAGDPAVEDPHRQAELPSEEEVAAAKRELEEKMRVERACLQQFFENCSLDLSFTALRMRTATDRETLGNGFWEVLRDAAGRIAQFNYVAGFTVRLMPLDKEPVEVEERVRVDAVTWGEIRRLKRLRRYVQIVERGLRPIYFRELGDPRTVSSKTGRVYVSATEMRDAEGDDAKTATELVHFRVASSRSAYGVPRWIGQLLAVLGSRQVDEINFAYFDNKSVPPLLITISDGRMSEESVERLRTHIDSEIKGKRNFHKILVLEAESAGTTEPGQPHSGRTKINVQPLTMAQHNDALFQKYDERNVDKVGMAFRLPRMLRGDIRDFNRASAEAALEFAEKQVFAPERGEFDFLVNRVILPRLGVRFWRFCTNSPALTDPKEQGQLVVAMANAGVLTPDEARQEAAKVLNRELPRLSAPWTRQPLQLTLAGVAPPGEAPAGPAAGKPAAEPTAEPPAEVGAEPTIGAGGGFTLNPTAISSSLTLNEIRTFARAGPLKRPDGTPDPDADLILDEFKMRRGLAARPPDAEAEGEAEEKALETGDLGSRGGLLQPAQGVPRGDEDLRFRRRVVRDAAYLLQLRNAMEEAEARETERAHAAARKAEAEPAEG